MLFCRNFMPETNCFKTPSLCFQDLGTQAPSCWLAGAGAGAQAWLICLQGVRARSVASEQSCPPTETGNCSSWQMVTSFHPGICFQYVWLAGCRNSSQAMQLMTSCLTGLWLDSPGRLGLMLDPREGMQNWPQGRNVMMQF